jgi:putative MFS transporter
MSAGIINESGVGARLDRLPVGPFHYRIIALIGAGMFIDSFDIYLGSGVLAVLVKSGYSTMATNASFLSYTFYGLVIGSWLAGVTGDRYGRRFAYRFNLAVMGFTGLAAAASPSMNVLIALRFLMGIAIGSEVVVGYSMLTEFVPARSRARWVMVLALIYNSAALACSLATYWIVPQFGWRYMFVLPAVSALIVWFLRRSLPESPRWLEAQGRKDEADKIVASAEAEAIGRGVTLPAPSLVPVHHPKPVSMLVLFTRPVIRRTLIALLLNLMVAVGTFGFVTWFPSFLVKQGMTVQTSLYYNILLSIGSPVGTLVALFFGDRIQPKTGIVAVSLVAVAAGLILPFTGYGMLFLWVGFCLSSAIFASNVFGFVVHTPELFPTQYRLRAIGFCSTVGRLATAGIQPIVVIVFAWKGLDGIVAFLVTAFALQAVLMAVFGIRTKQRSLEALAPETDRALDARLDQEKRAWQR